MVVKKLRYSTAKEWSGGYRVPSPEGAVISNKCINAESVYLGGEAEFTLFTETTFRFLFGHKK